VGVDGVGDGDGRSAELGSIRTFRQHDDESCGETHPSGKAVAVADAVNAHDYGADRLV
jgi:hypothetical protein